jgi:VanZ family protein
VMFWCVAVAAVVVGSLLPATTLMRLHYDSIAPNDKLVHFLGYTVLAIVPVAFVEFAGTGIALAASMIPMGVLLEFLQRLVPGRSFEVGDMLADSIGVMTGTILALWIRSILKRLVVVPQEQSN